MKWFVRTTIAAEADFDRVTTKSAEDFGADQALRYARSIRAAIQEVEDIKLPGDAEQVKPGLEVYIRRVRRRGRKGRHVFYFRAYPDRSPPTIHVIRILHDSMVRRAICPKTTTARIELHAKSRAGRMQMNPSV